MAFTLPPDPGETSSDLAAARDDQGYSISSDPLVSTGSELGGDAEAPSLPRTYGRDIVCLMARDPQTLFAYWDIDWTKAFGEAAPRERDVHLRILGNAGEEKADLVVEPMAGSCLVETATDEADYRAEIGYYASGSWVPIATSMPITAPAARVAGDTEANLATIPLHLSFQRMLDALRVPKHEGRSLTGMLTSLQERAASDATAELSTDERAVAASLHQAAAQQPPVRRDPAKPRQIWSRERIESLLGVPPTSPNGGFAGSSRA